MWRQGRCTASDCESHVIVVLSHASHLLLGATAAPVCVHVTAWLGLIVETRVNIGSRIGEPVTWQRLRRKSLRQIKTNCQTVTDKKESTVALWSEQIKGSIFLDQNTPKCNWQVNVNMLRPTSEHLSSKRSIYVLPVRSFHFLLYQPHNVKIL